MAKTNQEFADELSRLGKREARLMAKLQKVQTDRCDLLQEVAAITGSDEIIATAAAPKTEPE